MAVIAVDTWTGSDGSAWSSQWTTKMSGVTTISGNQGQLAPANSNANLVSRVDLTGMAGTTNMDVVVYVTAVTSGVEQYALVGVDTDPSGETGFGNSPYEVYFQFSYNATAASSSVSCWQGTNTISTTTRTLTGGVKYGVRVRRYYDTFYMRSWTSSGTEPTSWDFTVPVNNLPGRLNLPSPSGIVSFGIQNGTSAGSRPFLFDDMTVDDLNPSVAWLRV